MSKNIVQKLIAIQSDLKAPKNQLNSFGGYKYRNCEDILEAVKPLLNRENVALVITDELVIDAERNYVKAVATLYDAESDATVLGVGLAEIEISKKGMDASQRTGCASSYARKYALNGLFCIDDTKDSDNFPPEEAHKKTTKKAEAPAALEPKEHKCAECGKPFTEFTDKNGKRWSAGQVYHMAVSSNIDGIARCRDCSLKMGTRKEASNG